MIGSRLSKFLLLWLMVVGIALTAHADEPPCWCAFSTSAGDFEANVQRQADLGDDVPIRDGWKVVVTQKEKGSTLWEGPIQYNGYPEGRLTPDGQYFSTLDTWYYAERPVFTVYHAEGVVLQKMGNAFKVPPSELVQTASHYLWLADQNEFSSAPDGEGHWQYTITTIDGEKHRFSTRNPLPAAEKPVIEPAEPAEEESNFPWSYVITVIVIIVITGIVQIIRVIRS